MAIKRNQEELNKKLLMSCFIGDTVGVSSAIARGAVIDPVLVLRDAAGAGHAHILRLLKENGVDVAKYGAAALVVAAQNGEIECVDLLLRNGVDANTDDNAAINAAAGNCQTLVVDRLIMSGAKTDKALSIAVFWLLANEGMDGEEGYRNVVDCLVANQANIRAARAMLIGDIKGCGDQNMENKVKASGLWNELAGAQSSVSRTNSMNY